MTPSEFNDTSNVMMVLLETARILALPVNDEPGSRNWTIGDLPEWIAQDAARRGWPHLRKFKVKAEMPTLDDIVAETCRMLGMPKPYKVSKLPDHARAFIAWPRKKVR